MSDIDAIFKLFDHYRSDVVDLSRSYNKLFDEVLKIKRDIRELKEAKLPVRGYDDTIERRQIWKVI